MKRRFFAMLLSLAMLFTLAPTAFAAGNTETSGSQPTGMSGNCGATDNKSNVKWELTQNNEDRENPTYTLTISGSGDMANFTVPTKPNDAGANVAPWYTKLADLENSENHTVPITEVVVQNGVTGLGNWAFAYTQVTKATFTESVKSYGIRLYSNCTELTTVDWANFAPEQVMLSEDDTEFYKGVAIPGHLFDTDRNLHICIVDGTTYTDTLVVPDNVAAVGTSGFYGTAFQTVDFKNNLPDVKEVGYYSFAKMQSLKSLTIPGYMQFVLGGTSKKLSSNAFSEASNATSMVIEEGIEVIPASMARQWDSMETLQLPSTITRIETNAFANPQQLHSVDASKITGPLKVENAFNTYNNNKAVNCIFYVNSSDIQTVLNSDNWGTRNNYKIFAVTNGGTFPADTTFESGKLATPVKDSCAFAGWYTKDGTNDNWGDKVTSSTKLTAGATYYAKWNTAVLSGNCGAKGNEKNVQWALTKNTDGTTYTLTISGNGAMADYSCNITRDDAAQPWRESQTGVAPSAISKVVVGSGVTNIGMFACNGLNQVREYDISATVQTISSWGIDTQSVEMFTLNGNENFIVDEDGVLMNAAKDTMIAYPGGKAQIPEYEIPSSVKTLVSGVFVGSQIDKIIIPNTVESVAAWSFSASTAKEVVFDVNVQTLPKGMFSGMTNLTQLTFGKHAKIEEIANAALSGLNSIKTFDLPASLKKIGEMSLGQNTSMTELTLPDGLEEIGVQAFKAVLGVEGNLSKLTFGKKMPEMTDNGSSRQILLGQNKLDAVDMTRCTSEVYSIDCFNRGYDGIPVVYTANEAVATKAKTANNNLMAYAVANGGTFPDDTKFEAGKLATPVMDGYRFDGWYEDSGFTGNAVTTAEAGQTYYAKWEVKAEKTAPAAPTLKDRTYTSITLNTIEGAQYRCNDGAWQTTPEFTGLTAGTTYTFEAYYPETADCKASPTSGAVEFSTLRHSSSSSNPTYSVTTPSKSENGGVAVSSKNARKGDTVTVTVTPDAGYQLDKLTVTDKNGNVLKLTDKGDGKYSFTMPDGKVEVKAVFAKKVETSPFGDVSTDAYYYKAVQWAQEKGITDGISSNLFGPKQPCTRSQIVTFLWRAAGSPEPKGTAAGMTDVVPGSYYAKAVAWAVENGITTGTAEGTFSPDATCTRAQAVTFLARAQNAKATGKTAFSDVPADSYFADAVAWAQANGVTTGTSETTFSPDNDCTRAQIVTFLYRANQGT